MPQCLGILAFQGCIEPHRKAFETLGVECKNVRSRKDLKNITHLVIPGGESTTMLQFIEREELSGDLVAFGKSNPVWGICAGAILIAKEVVNPKQRSLGLIDVLATRNFYGSQTDSFKADISIDFLGINTTVDFIRAPQVRSLSNAVTVHSLMSGDPVFLQQGHIIATSFHIELGEERGIHEYFVGL